MIHRKMKLQLLLLINVTTVMIYGAQIIPGNAKGQRKSFEVPIKKMVSSVLGTSVYVGTNAQGVGAAHEFAIARLLPTESKWKPLVPQEGMLNNIYTNANPLFDARIMHLSLLLCADKTEEVMAVTKADPSSIYCVRTAREPIQVKVAGQQKTITTEVTSINSILDAHGNVTSGIIGISNPAKMVFAAVKPHQAANSLPVKFGENGSGIVAITSASVRGNDNTKNKIILLNLQAGTVEKSALTAGSTSACTTKAVAFNNIGEYIKIGNGIPIIEQDEVPMHWDNELERLYIGLNVTAGPGNGDGARSIVVGRLENRTKIIFEKFAPDEAFGSGNDEIVGTGVPGGQASVHELKTMHTSTGLTYLIVRGGNGPAAQTKNTLYALPLVVGSETRKLNGILASTDAQADGIYGPYKDFEPYLGRSLKKPVITNANMPKATDEAVVVGGGMTLPGTITSMMVRGDNVFVSIAETPIAGQSGIYYSRALHGPDGKIHSWTFWQRAVGTTDQVFGFVYNQTNSETVFMTGADAQTIDTIKRTSWSSSDKEGSANAVSIINTRFTKGKNAIENICDFSSRTPALGNINMMVFFGGSKVVIMQTGESYDDHIVIPTEATLYKNIHYFENGAIAYAIEPEHNARIIEISGGDLKNIGTITAAEIARDGNNGSNGWLCVGGSRGFGILADDMGKGWTDEMNQGMLHSGFVQLRPGMKFKKIGDYTFVRKIISDDQFLYILTDGKLDRIELTPEKIKSGNLQPTTIATSDTLKLGEYGTILDAVISEKFALLATCNGLFRIKNGQNVQTITNALNAWTSVEIPEQAGPALQLITVSKTGRSQDIARGFLIGQVYLVNGTYSRNISQLNRFIITNIEGKEINDETIQPFPDCYRKGHLSYLTNFGSIVDLFFTDGTLYLRARNERALTYVRIIAAFGRIQTGSIGYTFGNQVTKLPVTIKNDAIIRVLLRNSASGSLIIGGDFGIQVSE